MKLERLEDVVFRWYYDRNNPKTIVRSNSTNLCGEYIVIIKDVLNNVETYLLTKKKFKKSFNITEMNRFSNLIFRHYNCLDFPLSIYIGELARIVFDEERQEKTYKYFVLEEDPFYTLDTKLLTKEEIFKKYKIEI